MNSRLNSIKRFGALALVALTILPVYGATQTSRSTGDYKPSSNCQLILGKEHDYKPHVNDAKETDIYTVMLNGKIIDLSDPIVVRNNTVHLPVRAISNLLGIDIGYSQQYGVAFAEDQNTFLEIPVGHSEAVRNDKIKAIGNGNRSILHKDRTYLPLRFISEQFDTVTIDYIAATKTVAIKTNGVETPAVTPAPTAKPDVSDVTAEEIRQAKLQWSGGIARDNWDDPVAPGRLTPEQVCQGSRHPADIAPQYFKKFASPAEVKELIPTTKTADGRNFVCEKMNYVRMTVDISKERTFLIGGAEMGGRWGLYRGVSLPSAGYACYVMKDETFVDDDVDFDKGYDVTNLDYFYYTIDNTYFIYDIGSVDTVGLPN